MTRPPDGLCQVHAPAWREWHDYPRGYNPRHPRDAGSLGPILDSRTSHEERRRGWQKLADQQTALIEDICRSGWSLQCTPGHNPPHPCAGCGQQLGRDTGRRPGMPPYFTQSPGGRHPRFDCPAGGHHRLAEEAHE